ncbi:MAG: hypothetical protein AAB449_01285 [Patescibacteria group bacterium]
MSLYKIIVMVLAVVSLAVSPLAFAKDGVDSRGSGSQASSSQNVSDQDQDDDEDVNDDEDIDDDADEDVDDDSATSSRNRGPGKNASSTEDREDNEGRGKGEEHRSEVANFVHDLLELAGRDGGIGDEVREVARAQASTSDEAADDIDNLENENFFKKLFLGPDFKSLGRLRSALVATENHIDRLERAKERASTTTVALLDEQITALEDIASSTESFLKEHESTFSFLGWFVKFFSE